MKTQQTANKICSEFFLFLFAWSIGDSKQKKRSYRERTSKLFLITIINDHCQYISSTNKKEEKDEQYKTTTSNKKNLVHSRFGIIYFVSTAEKNSAWASLKKLLDHIVIFLIENRSKNYTTKNKKQTKQKTIRLFYSNKMKLPTSLFVISFIIGTIGSTGDEGGLNDEGIRINQDQTGTGSSLSSSSSSSPLPNTENNDELSYVIIEPEETITRKLFKPSQVCFLFFLLPPNDMIERVCLDTLVHIFFIIAFVSIRRSYKNLFCFVLFFSFLVF